MLKEVFLAFDYTEAEVLQMAKVLPSIYGLSIENIRKKVFNWHA